MIRKAEASDAKMLAKIHNKTLKGDFLPSLGTPFLEELYKIMIVHNYATGIVYTKSKQVIAFLIFATNSNTLFKQIFKKHFLRLAVLIIPKLINKPSNLVNILSTIFYSKKSSASSTQSELLIISVDTKYRRQGIGKLLISKLNHYLKKQKVSKYKVTLTADHKNAEAFYITLGFKNVSDFVLYGKKWKTYQKNL